MFPNELKVGELVNVLKEKKIGVVAHFYMDPEVQGVLTAAQKQWPHIHISDSLVMADSAVKMAKAGCKFITVLGVDFMSENVRAILDQAGFNEVCLSHTCLFSFQAEPSLSKKCDWYMRPVLKTCANILYEACHTCCSTLD